MFGGDGPRLTGGFHCENRQDPVWSLEDSWVSSPTMCGHSLDALHLPRVAESHPVHLDQHGCSLAFDTELTARTGTATTTLIRAGMAFI